MRLALFQLVGKTPRRLATQARDRSPRPFTRRPSRIGEKSNWIAGFTQATGETFKVGLGTTGFRMTAANETDCQARIIHPRGHH